MSALGRLVGGLLNILGNNDHCRSAAGECDTDCAVGDVPQLSRRADFLDEGRNVREDAIQVQLLLVACAADRCLGLTTDREHGHMVEGGIIETSQEVRRTRSAGCQANAEFPSELS